MKKHGADHDILLFWEECVCKGKSGCTPPEPSTVVNKKGQNCAVWLRWELWSKDVNTVLVFTTVPTHGPNFQVQLKVAILHEFDQGY